MVTQNIVLGMVWQITELSSDQYGIQPTLLQSNMDSSVSAKYVPTDIYF